MNTKVWLHYIPQSWASEVFSSIKEKKAKHTEEHLKDNWLNVPAVFHIRAMKRKLEVTFFFSVHMAWVLAPRVMAKTIVAENNVVARVQHKSKKKKNKIRFTCFNYTILSYRLLPSQTSQFWKQWEKNITVSESQSIWQPLKGKTALCSTERQIFRVLFGTVWRGRAYFSDEK